VLLSRAMNLSDYNYDLPEDLIAQFPPEQRGDSRLLCLDGCTGDLIDSHFSQFIDYLNPGDLLVFNDTKVMPARLFGNKETGGKVELLIERLVSTHQALAHIRASKSPKPGSMIILDNGVQLKIIGRQDALFLIESLGDDLSSVMSDQGHIPLPPYIERSDNDDDGDRYQTIYAKNTGAVAAPTAGLHFTDEMMMLLEAKGIETAFVTLHVGAGTFQPVRVDNLDDHVMHKEYVELNQAVVDIVERTKEKGGRVIAVGTTSVRSLESAALAGELKPMFADTNLFIRPGFKFNVVDAILTNFHLPESTLLMLISAFSGFDHVKQAYQHAIKEKYRFFSYGDAMFLSCKSGKGI